MEFLSWFPILHPWEPELGVDCWDYFPSTDGVALISLCQMSLRVNIAQAADSFVSVKNQHVFQDLRGLVKMFASFQA